MDRPLSNDEKRLILSQLLELKLARQTIIDYEIAIKRDQEQDARERELATRALDLANETTKLAQEKADLYKQLWETAKKKKCSVGGSILHYLSIGIYRCGG